MSFVPSPIGLQEILRLYDLPEQLILVGALYEKALASSQKTPSQDVEVTYGKMAAELLDNLFKPLRLDECLKNIELYILKLATLVRDASRMDQLSDTELLEWSAQTQSVKQYRSEVKKLAPEYAQATDEMAEYLEEALDYYQDARKN